MRQAHRHARTTTPTEKPSNFLRMALARTARVAPQGNKSVTKVDQESNNSGTRVSQQLEKQRSNSRVTVESPCNYLAMTTRGGVGGARASITTTSSVKKRFSGEVASSWMLLARSVTQRLACVYECV
jgi:hypothetical protein